MSKIVGQELKILYYKKLIKLRKIKISLTILLNNGKIHSNNKI